jgi:DNA mismatch repair ATPase MutS
MPPAVTNRAEEVLAQLEGTAQEPDGGGRAGVRGRRRQPTAVQLSFLSETHPVLADLLALDLAAMTPLEALTTLYRLQEWVRGVE